MVTELERNYGYYKEAFESRAKDIRILAERKVEVDAKIAAIVEAMPSWDAESGEIEPLGRIRMRAQIRLEEAKLAPLREQIARFTRYLEGAMENVEAAAVRDIMADRDE